MFNGFKAVRILLIFATTLSFALAGFTLLNVGNEEVAVAEPTVNKNIPLSAGAKLFRTNCKSCHDLDRIVIGPALRGAYTRRDSVWLRKWITNSSAMIATGDPEANRIFDEYKHVQMTNFTTMSKEDLDQLMDFLKRESTAPIP